jgi:hypothetical protein
MKFSLAILIYLVLALVLVWGIVLTVHGKPWLLVVGSLGYLAAFARVGCFPKKSH